MPQIHPTAIVDPAAKLHENVRIGPFCTVSAHVELGKDTQLLSHVSIQGPTTIGARNILHPFAALGGDPQHRNYNQQPTRLEIGDDNTIREHVTIHRGTSDGGGITRIGNSCLLMAGSHVAHDVIVGDHVTLTNGVLVGGHVKIDDWVVAAGHVAIAPFARIGESAFLAGNAMIERDVPPFLIAAGDRATLRAINKVGLQRRAIPEPSLRLIHQAFLRFFPLDGPRKSWDDPKTNLNEDPFVARMIAFLQASSRLGHMPRHRFREKLGDSKAPDGMVET